MFVRDFMTRNPLTITPEVSHPDALALMRKHHVRRLPVINKGNLVGIVSEQDMLSNQPSQATSLSVYEIYSLLSRLRIQDIMVRPVVTVEGDCPMEEAASIMVTRKIGCLPVMEGDRIVGIITETDVFRALVEVLGGKEAGLRVVVRLPERVGEVARMTAEIATAGGNIVAITSSQVLEGRYREGTLKVTGLSPEAFRGLLQNHNIEIIDMRSLITYEPKLCG
jgi:acetoin utilization protein AcuB